MTKDILKEMFHKRYWESDSRSDESGSDDSDTDKDIGGSCGSDDYSSDND